MRCLGISLARLLWHGGSVCGTAVVLHWALKRTPLLCTASALLCTPQYPDWPTLSAKFNELAPRLMSVDGAKNVLGLELVPAGIFLQEYYDPTSNKSNVNPIGTGACVGLSFQRREGKQPASQPALRPLHGHGVVYMRIAARAAAVVGKPWGGGSS